MKSMEIFPQEGASSGLEEQIGKMKPNQFTKQGFTLIELMVVVSIIGVLTTILYPMAGSMVRTAQETKCAVEIKSLCSWAISYSNDHDGLLPDLRKHPISGNDVGQFSYHTWTQWRDQMVLDGIPRDLLYGPTNEKWNRDDFWDFRDGKTVMGRFYFASERYGDSTFASKLMNTPDITIPVFPHGHTHDAMFDILWSDLNRQFPVSSGDNWITPGDPLRYGSNHLYPDTDGWPRGSHTGHLDGHVEWVPGKDIVHRLTWQGAEIYW